MNIAILDASRRARDPTGTGGIRQRFRLDAERRVQMLKGLAQTAIVDHDVLGLNMGKSTQIGSSLPGAAILSGAPLKAFSSWFNQAIYSTLVGNDGAWVRDHVRQATIAGISKAQRELAGQHVAAVDFTRSDMISTLAAHELAGIADATTQQVMRVTGDAVMSHQTPAMLARAVADRIDKIATTRTNALANQIVVKAYNDAKLDVYAGAGLTHVGVNPERQPKPKTRAVKVTRDADPPAKKPDPGLLATLLGGGLAAGVLGGLLGGALLGGGEEDMVEVVTAGDDLVCDECQGIADDGPYTLDEARTLIPAHPNCRCEFMPAFT